MSLWSKRTSIDTDLNETPSVYLDMGIAYIYLYIRVFLKHLKV